MNRATFDEVVTDMSRLVEQIADLKSGEIESLEGMEKNFSNHPVSRIAARTSRQVALRA